MEEKNARLQHDVYRNTEDVIRLREELSEQYRALKELKRTWTKIWFRFKLSSRKLQRSSSWLYLSIPCCN